MTEYPNADHGADAPELVFGRLMTLAAQRAGGPSALGRALGVTAAEVEHFASGAAVPPKHIVLRTVDWIIDYYAAKAAVRRAVRSWRAPDHR